MFRSQEKRGSSEGLGNKDQETCRWVLRLKTKLLATNTIIVGSDLRLVEVINSHTTWFLERERVFNISIWGIVVAADFCCCCCSSHIKIPSFSLPPPYILNRRSIEINSGPLAGKNWPRTKEGPFRHPTQLVNVNCSKPKCVMSGVHISLLSSVSI
jgi:hypothetical protein